VTGTARAPKASTVAGGEALGRQDVPPGCPSETGDSPSEKTPFRPWMLRMNSVPESLIMMASREKKTEAAPRWG
jgi:hypothetical protein